MNLFRIRGIQLAVHLTFLLLLLLVAWDGWSVEGWSGMAWSVGYLVMLFVCITLHELGHAFAAKVYGIHVPRILLLPIGGMAELDFIPRQPRQEWMITLAGPAVNFALVMILLCVVPWPGWRWDEASPIGVVTFLQDLLRFNLIMGLFNLIPVFPMDGGRLLRATLACRLPYLRATEIAARMGQVLAIAAATFILIRWPIRMALAAVLFIFIAVAAESEYRATRIRERSLLPEVP